MKLSSRQARFLREEWRHLDKETRAAALRVVEGLGQEDRTARLANDLERLGLSPELAAGIAEAVSRQTRVRTAGIGRLLEESLDKTAVDYFNGAVGSGIALVVELLWMRQEWAAANGQDVPIGLGLATAFVVVTASIFLNHVRRWIRELGR